MYQAQLDLMTSDNVAPEKSLERFNYLYKKALEPQYLSAGDCLDIMDSFLHRLKYGGLGLHQRERDEKSLEILEEIVNHPQFRKLSKWEREPVLEQYKKLKDK